LNDIHQRIKEVKHKLLSKTSIIKIEEAKRNSLPYYTTD